MHPKTYFEAKIQGLLPQLSKEQKDLIAKWMSDPIYDLSAEDPHPAMKMIEDFQKMIWIINRLQEDSDELNTYKETIKYVKNFLS